MEERVRHHEVVSVTVNFQWIQCQGVFFSLNLWPWVTITRLLSLGGYYHTKTPPKIGKSHFDHLSSEGIHFMLFTLLRRQFWWRNENVHNLQNFPRGGLGGVPSNPPLLLHRDWCFPSENYGGKLKISFVASGLQSAFETQQWPPSLNGSRKREPSQSPSKCRLLSLVSLQGRTFLAKTMIAFGPFIFPPYLRHHDLSLPGSTRNPQYVSSLCLVSKWGNSNINTLILSV